MKYIKTFEKKKYNYYIYSKRFNDYSDGIKKNIDMLDDNNIEYDVYIMTQNNHDFFIIYAYSKNLYNKNFDVNTFHYCPTLTAVYGSYSLDEIKNKIKNGNFEPDGISWTSISKETLIWKFVTNKFNL